MTEIQNILELDVDIQGMTCASCAAHVEKALKSVPGVAEAHVPGWESGQATVVAREGVEPAALEAAVEQAGYRGKVKPTNGQRHGAFHRQRPE